MVRLMGIWLWLCTITSFVASDSHAQSKPGHASTGPVTVVVQPVFDGQPLVLAGRNYVDEHGDTLSIDVFRFYMTNVRLDVKTPQSHGHTAYTADILINKAFLFNAEDTDASHFTAENLAGGTFTGISFTLGVDSAANTSGANEGDLDPAKGMYWAWNSGYIMAKLEGHSKVCKTLHHAFEFHIGGYMPPYNTAREVHLTFPRDMEVKSGDNIEIKINADVAAWFRGNVDLSKTNSVMIPGRDAAATADKYAKMFTVSQTSK